MRLQNPINPKSLKLDTSDLEYQQLAKTAMQRVALVTDPSLSKEQKQVLYELHMPELAGNHSGIQREVTPSRVSPVFPCTRTLRTQRLTKSVIFYQSTQKIKQRNFQL